MSQRHTCARAGQHRSVQRHRSQRQRDPALERRLQELAKERPRFGYRRLTILLRRKVFRVNDKRVYRLYRALGLVIRSKRRKRASRASRQPVTATASANE